MMFETIPMMCPRARLWRLRIVVTAGLCAWFACFGAVTVNASLDDIQTAIIGEDFSRAEKLAREFIAGSAPEPQRQEALYYLGLSQLQVGRHAEAYDTFRRLLNSLPERRLRDKAYIGTIDALYFQGAYDEAAKVADTLLERSPRSEFLTLIYLKAARANLKLARWQKAQIFLRKIQREFPESFEASIARQLLEEEQFFTVQVGAFLDPSKAEELMQTLDSRGEYAYIVKTTDRFGQVFYRVRVGRLTTLRDAENLKARLSQLGYPALIYP